MRTRNLPRSEGTAARLLAAALVLTLLPLLLGACQGAPAQGAAQKGTKAPADSLAAAPTDSVAAGKDESKGGFLARVFGNRGKKDKEKNEDDPVPVELAVVSRADVPLYLSATATLEAEKQADILAKIAGEVREIRVEEGDWVREGQVLAVLDGEAQGVVLEEAEARVRALERDLERMTSLHAMKLTSDKELSDTRFRYEEAEAQRKAARLQVDYTDIRAPFEGRVRERFIDPGQTVAVGTPLFSVADPHPLLARIHLPEKDMVRISPAQDVLVQPDSDPSSSYSGQVLRVAPGVDPRTGTVKTTCQVDDPTGALRPGSFVRVRIRTDVHGRALVVPKRALVPEAGDTFVFKAEGDSVLKVPVSTGYADGNMMEVLAGLAEGDRVVTVGQGALKTGSRVRDAKEAVEKPPAEEKGRGK